MAKDVAGTSRVNMFEQIKGPSGTVYEPMSRIGNKVEYRVKGTEERFYASDHRQDGQSLDWQRQQAASKDMTSALGIY